MTCPVYLAPKLRWPWAGTLDSGDYPHGSAARIRGQRGNRRETGMLSKESKASWGQRLRTGGVR